MKKLILHFFLLVLGVLFNFARNAIYKYSEFSKTLLQKNLEFIPGDEVAPVLFFYSLMLFSSKIDLITKNKATKTICLELVMLVISK